jgi:hypothetical protein
MQKKTNQVVSLILTFLLASPTFGQGFYFARAAVADSFSPDDITGIGMWLAARDNGVDTPTDGSAVSTWTDRSGNGFHATQSDGTKKPSYETNMINGLPAIQFDGSADILTSSSTNYGTIIGVVAQDTLTVNKSWAGGASGTAGQSEAFYLGISGTSSTARFRVGYGAGTGISVVGTAGGTVVADTFAIWSATLSGTTMRFWWNGVEQTPATAAGVPKVLDGLFYIGGGIHNNTVVDWWNGWVAEVITYGPAIADSDREDVETYLAGIYGMTLPNFDNTLADLDSNSGAIDSDSGDVDGDGGIDFVTVSPPSSIDSHLRLWKWNGTSGFTSHDVISGATVDGKEDRFGTDIRLVDIDGDTDLDILLIDSSNSGNDGSLVWYEHPGTWNGSWTEHTIDTFSGSGTGNMITHSEVIGGDINQDGHTDIVARDISHGVWVWIQDSPYDGSTWEVRNFTATNPREGLALWNPDGDGDLDILINGVWLETPADPVAGTYTIHAIEGAEDWYPGSAGATEIADYACKVRVHDFNGDGKQDFIITNAEELSGSSASKPRGIRVFFQPTDPINDTWTEVTIDADHYSWHNAELADFDADGDMDLFTGISDVGVDTEPGKTVVFVNGGNGASWSEVSISSDMVYQIAVGDVDEDGDVDVLAPGAYDSGAIQYYRRR